MEFSAARPVVEFVTKREQTQLGLAFCARVLHKGLRTARVFLVMHFQKTNRWGWVLALGLVLGAAGFSAARTAAQANETLVFVVHGLRSDTGILRGGIYASGAVWTTVGGQVATCTARPTGGTARCVIRAPGPGRYAFAFYHDADGDGALDTDMVGIPQEGYGFSNNVRPGLSAPSFDSASFAVGAGETYEASLDARYGWTL